MISLHTSPLDQPGTGDAGGMNVYVIELSRRLARQGIAVDVFTRATSSSLPPVVEVPGTDGAVLVRHVAAGPVRGAHQGRAARPAVHLRPRGAAHRGGPPAGSLRRRALPLLALRPGRGAGPRPVAGAAGALDAHHGQGQERRARRGRHPRAGGPGHRRGAGRAGRGPAGRQHRPRGQAAHQPVRRRPLARRGHPPRRRPRRLPPDGPRGGPPRRSTCPPTRRC